MKKKALLILLFTVVLAFTISGTVAYFSKQFTSDNNTATAATFNVDVVNNEGNTIGDGQFELGEDLYPGMEMKEVYSFEIEKNDTELPVNYLINFASSGDLFPEEGSSPINMMVQRMVDGEWETLHDYADGFYPLSDPEKYRVLVDWPHGDNDIAYQGATGNVKLEVTAMQVDKVDEEELSGLHQEVVNALEALDRIGVNFAPGFTKADAAEVQEQIDDFLAYVEGLPMGEKRTEYLGKASELQEQLNNMIEARYVYYEIVEEETTMTQLKFNTSADFWRTGSYDRLENNKAIQLLNSGGAFLLRYYGSNPNPEVGDKWRTTLRFNGGVKTIPVFITNLGDGEWQIESEWLLEAE